MPSRHSGPSGNEQVGTHAQPWYQRGVAEDIAADADPRRHREPYQTDEYDENLGPGRRHEVLPYDEQLLEIIRECLDEDPRIDAQTIDVQIHGHTIELNGEVADPGVRHDVEVLVRNCADSKDIDNRLGVRSADD
jgi:hypothetical protein